MGAIPQWLPPLSLSPNPSSTRRKVLAFTSSKSSLDFSPHSNLFYNHNPFILLLLLLHLLQFNSCIKILNDKLKKNNNKFDNYFSIMIVNNKLTLLPDVGIKIKINNILT